MSLTQQARDRLISLFSFFRAVELRRSPVVRRIEERSWFQRLKELPNHECLQFSYTGEDNTWLTVVRPEIHACPRPPESLDGWLHGGWEDPSAPEVQPISVRTNLDDQGNPYETRFEEEPRRIHDLADWKQRRDMWAEVERPARDVLLVWERLFSLHSQLEREGESFELIVGDGIFDWHGLHHPILCHRVELAFEPRTRKFRVADTDIAPEFYAALLAGDEFAGMPVKNWQQELQSGEIHPLGGEGVTDWLKGIIGRFSNGEFINGEPVANAPHPRMGRAPVLFLRRREAGRVQFIEEILARINDGADVPQSLLSVVGCAPEPLSQPEPYETAIANEVEDVLLSKPANAAQLDILHRLAHQHGVVVQGPPGTGKTHTIANLIGNLLAEGKSVLVTSHTTKALRVLRRQVVDALQPLCVSVLDSDVAGRRELEFAVNSLANRLSDDLGKMQREVEEHTKRRIQILAALRCARRDLEVAVQSEYKPLILSGEEHDPVVAAKEVASGAAKNDWIPAPLVPGHPTPLSEAELKDLYESHSIITMDDETELKQRLPSPEGLMPPDKFDRVLNELTELEQGDLEFRRDLWGALHHPASDIESVLDHVQLAIEQLLISEREPWRLAAIEAGIEVGANVRVWELMCKEIEEVQKRANGAAEFLFHYSPQNPETADIETHTSVIDEILAFFDRGGKLTTFQLIWRPRWKAYIQSARINGSSRPSKPEHFRALKAEVVLRLARSKLVSAWHAHMEPLGVPALQGAGRHPEQYAGQYIPMIRICLAWHREIWHPVERDLVTHGLNWPKLASEAPVTMTPHHRAERLRHVVRRFLPKVVRSELNRRRHSHLISEIGRRQKELDEYTGVESACKIRQAIADRNPADYRCAHARLETLLRLRPYFESRVKFLARLHVSAPSWADAIRQRIPPHDARVPPGQLDVAWRWRQFSAELDRRADLSVPALQEMIERLGDELRQVTAELIERRAWVALISAIQKNEAARQALLGWAATMKKIGAGTGANVPALKRQAQKLMGQARCAVPVWIMPFSRVTESFLPGRDHFDVLIVDEASQEDVIGLAPFYLARKVIVVGDDEQVTPLDVGGQQQPIHDLIQQWLGDLPSPLVFDLKTSVYDRARIAFGAAIRLLEHFRCVPEIIQFSNHLSYGGEIRPLRESASTVIKPALVAYRVEGERIGKKNLAEAACIASLITAAIEQPEYAGKTFGVVTLMGDEQAYEIERRLRTRIDAVEYESRRMLCGSPAHFQGDERDVMLLSMVDSRTEGEGPLGMKADGADGMWKKRYNVAASRAKDQLWVVYSLDHQTQLKPGDLRRRLIEHAIDPSALMRQLEEGLARAESPFEAEIIGRLVAEGYQVHPQWRVGAYRIDMVVTGENGKRLAIECDGDRYHYNKVADDLARQALLERLGWRFVRIRGTTYYRDKKAAMSAVYEKLVYYGITPVSRQGDDRAEQLPTELLSERIKRRAVALQAQWASQSDLV